MYVSHLNVLTLASVPAQMALLAVPSEHVQTSWLCSLTFFNLSLAQASITHLLQDAQYHPCAQERESN
jgi:hypothetical protein